jgi:hypothetical protein
MSSNADQNPSSPTADEKEEIFSRDSVELGGVCDRQPGPIMMQKLIVGAMKLPPRYYY